jgi:hypothetical protein
MSKSNGKQVTSTGTNSQGNNYVQYNDGGYSYTNTKPGTKSGSQLGVLTRGPNSGSQIAVPNQGPNSGSQTPPLKNSILSFFYNLQMAPSKAATTTPAKATPSTRTKTLATSSTRTRTEIPGLTRKPEKVAKAANHPEMAARSNSVPTIILFL